MSIENLPPEMQARIQDIIAQAQQAPAKPQQVAPDERRAFDQAPIQRPPSLMDHTIALRQEIAALSQQLQAIGQVVEATGQATGALYQMFHEQTTATNQGATYEAEAPDY